LESKQLPISASRRSGLEVHLPPVRMSDDGGELN
jgi:hypothetical protein